MKLLGRNKKNAEVSTKPKTPPPTKGQKKKGFFLPFEKGAEKKKKGFFLPYENKDKYDSKRGFFRRSSRKMAAPDMAGTPVQTETRAPVEPTPPSPMAPVVEETPKQAEPSPKQSEPVVAETVHSADHEDEARPSSPMAEDAPVAEERDEEHDHDDKDEDGPAEPEGRSEEAEGEPAEKNHTACSREESERADSKMSTDEPAEESTGLLCGCI